MNFERYPFEKLNELLGKIEPNSSFEPISLTIGEPQFETPEPIQNALKESTNLLNRYPKTAGEDYLKDAMLNYVRERFGVELSKSELVPLFGTREFLFNFPQFLLFDKPNPKMAFPNPFYQIYEGASIASRAEVVHLNLTKESNFLPVIDREALKDCNLVILNTPNNPTGSVMSFESMKEWVKLALEFDFVLLNDECYVDLYRNEKIPSLLEASLAVGNSSFKNILVANSISKRNSAPGLRSGFIAGDEKILKNYLQYRTYVGCASPLPLQRASAVAWRDFEYSSKFREAYAKNLELAEEILGVKAPEATFYIYFEVGDELEFTKKLFKEYNTKVLPATFLGRNGIGSGYVRIALVYDYETTREALKRVANCYKSIKDSEKN